MRVGRGRVLYATVMLAALAVRAWDLNARSLWFDEAGEYWVATAPFGALAQSVRTGSGDPPLYSFLLHAWLALGSSTLWLRSLSVIASLAGVAGAMVLARRLAGARAALAAGVMLAVLPADVRYAQEAGQYALMVAAIAWSLVALHRLWTEPSPRAGIVWAATALIASYAYYGAVLAITAPFVCVVAEALLRRERARMRGLLAGLAGYALGMLPLVLFILPAQLSRVVASDVSSAGPGAEAFGPGTMAAWVNTVLAFQFTGWPYTRVPAAVPVLAALLLLALAARTQRRVLAWLCATWAVHGLADAAGIFPYGFRWGLILAPLLVTGAACGFAAAGGRGMRPGAWIAATLLVLGSVASLPNRSLRTTLYAGADWPWPETEDMRAVLSHWRAHRAPGQPTYVYYGAVPAFAYYTRDEAWTQGLRATWFLDCWHGATVCSAADVYYGRWMRGMNPAQRLAEVFRSFGGAPDAFWVLFSHMQPNDDRDLVADIVANGYRIESVSQGTGTAVFLFTRS